jgi:hypothetical protein
MLSDMALTQLAMPTGIDQCILDARVVRLARTPHFIAFRATMQREFNERMELLRSDIHNDLVGEIFEIQRELRGKVGSHKLAEMLSQYRDESLYSNVKMLMNDMNELKNTKVDTYQFIEGLRSKADHRSLDFKVDKTILAQQFDNVDRRMEEMFSSLGRHEVHLRSLESNLTRVSHTVNRRPSQLPSTPGSGFDNYIANHAFVKEDGRTASPPPAAGPRPPVRRSTLNGQSQDAVRRLVAKAQRQHSGNSVATLEQILEETFPTQSVVSEIRDLSKLHINVIHRSHEEAINKAVVRAKSSERSSPQEEPSHPQGSPRAGASSRGADPDLESREATSTNNPELPPLEKHRSPKVSDVGARSSSAQHAKSGAYISLRPGTTQHRVASGHLGAKAAHPPQIAGAPSSTSNIPLTPTQEAYCKVVDLEASDGRDLFSAGTRSSRAAARRPPRDLTPQ